LKRAKENEKGIAILSNLIEACEKILACPICHSKFSLDSLPDFLECRKCSKKYRIIENTIPSLIVRPEKEFEFSLRKWDAIYEDEKNAVDAEKDWLDNHKKDTMEQLNIAMKGMQKGIFLEMGSGYGFVGEELAKNGWLFIAADFSLNALKCLRSRLENRGIKNFLLVHCDIRALPFSDDSIDGVYGGGVIEHFRDPEAILKDTHRILKSRGISFNTVPLLNLGNFFYRFQWGAIPNIPILRGIAESFHINLLGGRHMKFGYELMLSESQLRKMHESAGFLKDEISTGRFNCRIKLESIKNKRIKKMLIHLAKNNRNFWPMVKAIAKKGGMLPPSTI